MANRNSRTKNSALSLVTGLGGQAFNEALRFITRTVFIYTLGKMFLGINGLFAEIMTMLSLTNLGVGTAIIYRLYKPIAENDDHQVRVLLKFYKKAYQIIGCVILVLGLCLLPFLDILIKDYDRLGTLGLNAEVVYLLFLGQSVVSYFFFAYRNCVFSADQKQYIINSVNIITNIITAALQIAVLFIWKDFIVYLLIGIIDNILKNIVVAILTYKKYPNYFKKEHDSLPKKEVKLMFKDCGALLVYKMSVVINKSSGNLILSAFIGLAIVGLYSNYVMLYAATTMLIAQVLSSIKGSLGNLYATSTNENKYFFFEVTNFATIAVAGTIGVIIAVCTDEFITQWIGNDYVIEQPFSLLMGIEVLTYGMQTNLGQVRNVAGLFRQMWVRPIISMAVTLVSTLILVKIIGIYAIPLGIIMGRMVIFAADPVILHRIGFHNIKPASAYYIRNGKYTLIVALIGIADYFLCKYIVPGHGWISILSHVLICGLTVPSALFLVLKNAPECAYLCDKVEPVVNKVLRKKM